MRADDAMLKSTLEQILRDSPLESRVDGFELSEGYLADDDAFLRVVVRPKTGATWSDDDALAFKRAVERRLRDVDDRFASVRFPDFP